MLTAVDKSNLVPRYLQVRAILEHRIRIGEIAPGDRIPSERDFAKELDVSQMTVNKAVALLVQEGWLRRELGNGTFVNENLRVPAPAAISIGFAIPPLTAAIQEDYFTGALLRGIQKSSMDRPASLRILNAHAESLASTFLECDLDGLIVVDLRDENRSAIERLVEDGKKILILGASDDSVAAPFIDGDNFTGTSEAVAHLLGQGHRRLVGLFALMETWNSKQRHFAFRKTLLANDVQIEDEQVLLDAGNGRRLTPETQQRLKDLLRRPDRPTAVMCGGFFLALETMHVIRSLGLDIPGDVSVVGYDDPASAPYLNPPLTTVRQPLEEMGEQAVTYLYNWIQFGTVPPMRTLLKESLVVRSSTSQV